MKIARNVWEVAAVILTALLHPVFVDVFHQRAVFIALALCGWTIYLGTRCWKEKNVLQHFGFRKQGLKGSFVATSVFAVAAMAAMGGVAVNRHALVIRWPMLVLLALYPIWGTFQQLLVQGVFVRTVISSASGVWPKVIATVVAALLFAAVHLPELKLAAATCLLGLAFTLIYLRWRNLWPLGLYHGWLGVFYYYWVLGRDPWAETFAGQQ